MLYAFIAGFGLLIGLMLTLNWFTSAQPREVLRVLKWVAVGLVLLLVVALVVTGRLGWALAALAALAPWAGRILRLVVFGQMARRAFAGLGGNPFRGMGGGGAASGAANRSTVTSRYLEMTLDHGSGAMDGRVLEGTYAGRRLAALSEREAVALWNEVSADGDSRRLLEAWLDRSYPDWRSRAEEESAAAGSEGRTASSTGTMTREEALEVLGLDGAADADTIRAAYRRLMARAHPDQGGSTWMAAKLNEARAVLLDGTK